MREYHHRPCKEATTNHVFELPGFQEAVFGEVSEKGIFLLREHAHHIGNGVTVVVPNIFEVEKTKTSSPTEKFFLAFLEMRLHHRHRESLFGHFLE